MERTQVRPDKTDKIEGTRERAGATWREVRWLGRRKTTLEQSGDSGDRQLSSLEKGFQKQQTQRKFDYLPTNTTKVDREKTQDTGRDISTAAMQTCFVTP